MTPGLQQIQREQLNHDNLQQQFRSVFHEEFKDHKQLLDKTYRLARSNNEMAKRCNVLISNVPELQNVPTRPVGLLEDKLLDFFNNRYSGLLRDQHNISKSDISNCHYMGKNRAGFSTVIVAFSLLKDAIRVMAAGRNLKERNSELMKANEPPIQLRRQHEELKTLQLGYLHQIRSFLIKTPGYQSKKKQQEVRIDSTLLDPTICIDSHWYTANNLDHHYSDIINQTFTEYVMAREDYNKKQATNRKKDNYHAHALLSANNPNDIPIPTAMANVIPTPANPNDQPLPVQYPIAAIQHQPMAVDNDLRAPPGTSSATPKRNDDNRSRSKTKKRTADTATFSPNGRHQSDKAKKQSKRAESNRR